MKKNLLVLALVVIFEVVGNVCLSRGMRMVGVVGLASLSSLPALLIHLVTNPWVMIGVALLICYFVSFLTALSRLELSYVLPMTASSYVLTCLVSSWVLGETISPTRWLGTCSICLGILFVGLSERKRTAPVESGSEAIEEAVP